MDIFEPGSQGAPKKGPGKKKNEKRKLPLGQNFQHILYIVASSKQQDCINFQVKHCESVLLPTIYQQDKRTKKIIGAIKPKTLLYQLWPLQQWIFVLSLDAHDICQPVTLTQMIPLS